MTCSPISSTAALQWALDYARRNGATLRVIHIWHYPYAASEAGAMMSPPAPVFEEGAQAMLDGALNGLDTTGVVVETAVRQGDVAHVLLEEEKGADLLVIGARGHGGFAGMILGSVATHCSAHARIPTVVVPHSSSEAAE